MEKLMCYGALAVSAIMTLVFLIDMIAGIPFGGGSFIGFDIFGLLASAVVVYLSINSMKEIR